MKWKYLLLMVCVGIFANIKVGNGQGPCTDPMDLTDNTDAGEPTFNFIWNWPMGISARIDDQTSNNLMRVGGMFQYDFPIGTTTVYAFDGTEVSCTFIVSVSDMEVPDINCPPDVTVTEPNKAFWSLPTVMDNSNQVTLIQTEGVTQDTITEEGDTGPVTYRAEDPSGNFDTCTFMVTVDNDPDLPSIVDCPPPEATDGIALRLTAPQDQEYTAATWKEPSDSTGNLERISNRSPGEDFFIGSTYVRYAFFVDDPASPTTECAFYVIVSRFADTEPPIVTCPPNVMVLGAFNVPRTAVTWETVTPVDNVGVQDSRFIPDSGSLFGIGVTTVNFNAVDAAGNEGKCDFTVTVVENNDNNDPVIENCPSDFTFYTTSDQQSPQVTWSLPTVFDDNMWTLVASMDPPVFLNVRLNPYTIMYTATDVAGNMATCSFDITVAVDNINPTVMCPGDVTEYVLEADRQIPVSLTWTDPVNLASDNSGQVSVQKTHNPGIFVIPGNPVQVTYTASDQFGQTEACMFTVSAVVDPAPVFTVCETESETLQTDNNQETVSHTWDVPTLTVTDSNPEPGGAISTTTGVEPNIMPPYLFPLGTTTLTYTATDVRGSISTCVVVITVVDEQLPQLVGCPAGPLEFMISDSTLRSAVVTWTEPQVQDNTMLITVTANINPGSSLPIGNYRVLYLAVDEAGNTGNCAFDVIVRGLPTDDQDPLISMCPINRDAIALQDVDFATVTWAVPGVTDNTDTNPVLVASHNPGDRFFIGETVVTYTASDDRGNRAVCSFTVTVADEQSPEFITCPPNIDLFIDPLESSALVKLADLRATDNSGVVVLQNNLPFTVDLADSPISRILIAEDPSGNQGTCALTVTLTPTTDVLVYPGQVVITMFEGLTTVPTDLTNIGRDLDNLFRCSSLANDFVDLRVTTNVGFTLQYELSLYSGSIANQYSMRGRYISTIVEQAFVNVLQGTPQRLFDTDNEVQLNSFQLTVCEFRGSFTLIAIEGGATPLDVSAILMPGMAAEGLLTQRILTQLDIIYRAHTTLSVSYITSVIILPFQQNAVVTDSIFVEFVLVFDATNLVTSEIVVNQAFTDEIQFNAVESRSEIRNSALFISGTAPVSIVKICADGFCANGGTCFVTATFVPTCTCALGFSGLQCQILPLTPPIPITQAPSTTGLSTAELIGIIAGVVGLLLLLLLLMCLCCCFFFLGSPKQPLPHSVPVPYERPVSYVAPPRPAIEYAPPPRYITEEPYVTQEPYVTHEPYVEMVVPEHIPNSSAVLGYHGYRQGPLIEEIDSYPAYKRDYLNGHYF